MKARAALVVVAALLGGASILSGADPGPQTVASAQLKDGRVLHNVRIMETEGAFVILRCDEGLMKIAATDLPISLSDSLKVAPPPPPDPSKPDYVMEWFDPNQAPAVPQPGPGTKPAKPAKPSQAASQTSKAQAPTTFRGCQIVSFQPKESQGVLGCAEVVFQNDTDQNVEIRPGMVVCITESGARLPGRYFFAETFPPAVRRRELIPANGQLTEIVTFTNDALNIASVRWMR